MSKVKKIIIDLDHTLTIDANNGYENATPNLNIIGRLEEFKKIGFEIVIHTSRNMRTYQGNVGKINAHTLPVIVKWLEKHHVPYDEIIVGKPWCGEEGFYVDDRSIRPTEFEKLSHDEIRNLLNINSNQDN